MPAFQSQHVMINTSLGGLREKTEEERKREEEKSERGGRGGENQ